MRSSNATNRSVSVRPSAWRPLVFVLTVLGGMFLLGLSIWPGALESAIFIAAIFLVPPLLLMGWVALLFAMVVKDFRGRANSGDKPTRWGIRATLVMMATLGLLVLHVPQRIAFSFCRTGFDQLAQGPGVVHDRNDSNVRIGIYSIERQATDPRGGVYYQTGTGPAGIGPDRISYGFALRPNAAGSPFGNAEYRRWRLWGEWYGFAASNDW